jgi:hypothetical protein
MTATTIQLAGPLGTLALSGGVATGVALLEYTPSRPDRIIDEAERLEELTPVVETVRVMFVGLTLAQVRTAINQIEQTFVDAEDWATYRYGSPCYMHFRPITSDTLYRSPIIGGKVEYDERLLRIGTITANIEATVTVRRAYWWESTTAVEISLSNRNGSGTGGITIRNVTNTATAGYDNYVEIAGASVVGSLRAPLQLWINHNDATNPTSSYANMWINLERLTAGQSFQVPVLEAEASVVAGTNQSDANCSGGQYRTITVSSSSEQILYRWALSQALLRQMNNQFVDILASFRTAPTNNTLLRAVIQYQSLTRLWEGDPVRATGFQNVIELGRVRLPPKSIGSEGSYSYASIQLSIFGRPIVTPDSITPELDFVYIPARAGWRRYRPVGYDVSNGETLIDDQALGELYVTTAYDTSTSRGGHYVGSGRLEVRPGVSQRIYIMRDFDQANRTYRVSSSARVRAYYRPRRVTI